MSINNLIEAPSNIQLRWAIYGRLEPTFEEPSNTNSMEIQFSSSFTPNPQEKEWLAAGSDGYQIVSEITFTEGMKDKDSLYGACVQHLGEEATGSVAVCHFISG